MGDSTTQMSARSNLTDTAMFVVWAIFGDFFGDIPDPALKIQCFNKFPGKNETGNPHGFHRNALVSSGCVPAPWPSSLWPSRQPAQIPGSVVPGSVSGEVQGDPGRLFIYITIYYITHRIHGAGIYTNIKGVYWWDPCYHIYQHHGSYGLLYIYIII